MAVMVVAATATVVVVVVVMMVTNGGGYDQEGYDSKSGDEDHVDNDKGYDSNMPEINK